MKKVITYGTFDLLHQGHINLLKRAKELGDYLIVGVTTDNYDRNRGKLNVVNPLFKRIEDVQSLGIADQIIIEEYEGQKIDDIQKYDVDIFTVGSDWVGKFDYIRNHCQLVYLDRTKGVSSTELREQHSRTLRLGIIGSGRIANRFVVESKFVSGIEVVGVFNPRLSSARSFCEAHELEFFSSDLAEFTQRVDAVYIASPHGTHFGYAKSCILMGKHVLCEKPLVLKRSESVELYDLAHQNGVVLKEAIKTAYCPSFGHLCSLVRSGIIGDIVDVSASITMLRSGDVRELDSDNNGGSINELSSYSLLPIFKLLGLDYRDITFYSKVRGGVDHYTRGVVLYDSAVATFVVALCAKTEGDLVISGTKGYAYVPAPWWKTSYFEIRHEDSGVSQKFFYRFDGDGLRYELSEFLQHINNPGYVDYRFTAQESIKISEVIEAYHRGENVVNI